MKRFKELISQYDWGETTTSIYNKTAKDVERALTKEYLNIDDFMALISPAAAPYLEQMASLSRKYTQQRFGKTIQVYLPMYLTNACMNHCIYCGFNHDNDIRRIILKPEEIAAESAAIKRLGNFQNILILTGESPRDAGVEYVAAAIRQLKPQYATVSAEIQPMDQNEYEQLIAEGLDSVYIYQETYHKARYKIYHPAGRKSDFDYRVDTPDRLGDAGIHRIGLGVLIGLEDWRTDVCMMARHLQYLERTYWRTKYSISFPRIRPHAGEGFKPNVVMSDKELAQLIFAFRIFDHDVEMSLSTRESADYRDHMMSLGITSISAGSKTEPGGYATYPQALEQFVINDNRSADLVFEAIRQNGYEVVWKDWDQSFS
ncbi:MAG: 2-iminoacetate synthase ThiH [Bacteroidales bacterium]